MGTISCSSPSLQLSIRQILTATAWVGAIVALPAHPTGNGWVLLVPFLAATLLWAAICSKRNGVKCVCLSWGLFLISVSLMTIELASGYGWRLPMVGSVPGPPGRIAQLMFEVLAAIVGVAALVWLISYGRKLKRWTMALAALPWCSWLLLLFRL